MALIQLWLLKEVPFLYFSSITQGDSLPSQPDHKVRVVEQCWVVTEFSEGHLILNEELYTTQHNH